LPEVSLICLANSRKPGGRCVAGIRTDNGEWVRPVSRTHSQGTLRLEVIQLTNDGDPQLLDLIRIDLDQPCPSRFQPENWYADRVPWKLEQRPADNVVIASLPLALGPTLLGDTQAATHATAFTDAPAPASLTLVRKRATEISWERTVNTGQNPRVVAHFSLSNQPYALIVTDPLIESRMYSWKQATYQSSALGFGDESDILLTVSMAEPFQLNNRCYKLVAGVAAIA